MAAQTTPSNTSARGPGAVPSPFIFGAADPTGLFEAASSPVPSDGGDGLLFGPLFGSAPAVASSGPVVFSAPSSSNFVLGAPAPAAAVSSAVGGASSADTLKPTAPSAHESQLLGSVPTPARKPPHSAPKVYDVVGDPARAAAELRADFAALKEQLPSATLDNAPTLLRESEALQKWMQLIQAADMSPQIAELRDIADKIKAWQMGSTGGTVQRHFCPFARTTLQTIEDLVRCVDKLQQVYGKDLAGMGIELPMIVAVGNESAGKSSVMEMIAGQPFFPRHEGTCTRLPFRLQFRRSQTTSVSFQNLEHSACNTSEEVQQLIAKVTKQRTNNKDVSTEELVLNIAMTDVPDLTLVDLPGLIGTTYASENRDLKGKVQKLVRSYVQQPHAIVLAVAAANTRLRDSEIWSIVKELGAEDRTIGLLTKCDLATDKRWRLEDKIGPRLSEAPAEEQEKCGYIPLRRGYYGMICRDTENQDRPSEQTETENAIDSAARREEQMFDDLIRDPLARKRCGVKTVYNALSSMFQKYIKETWRPETIKTVGSKIVETKRRLRNLQFSSRYREAPSSAEVGTPKYQQEVEERIGNIALSLQKLMESYGLSDQLLAKIPTDAVEIFLWGVKMKKAFNDVGEEVQSSIEELLKAHKSTRHLPNLRSFVRLYFMEHVGELIKQRADALAGVIALEAEEPLPQPCHLTRQPVHPDILPVAMQRSGEGPEGKCAVCHEKLQGKGGVELVRCCSKHFHAECLEKVELQASKQHQQPMCPLCRRGLKPAAATADADRQAARERLIQQARKSVAHIVRQLCALNIATGLASRAQRTPPTGANALLNEEPELQRKRADLRNKLCVLENVERDVNSWEDL